MKNILTLFFLLIGISLVNTSGVNAQCPADPCADPTTPIDADCIITTQVVETGSVPFSIIYDAATNGSNTQVIPIVIAEPAVPPCSNVSFNFTLNYTIDPFTPAMGFSWTSEASFEIQDLAGNVIASGGPSLPGSTDDGTPISGSTTSATTTTAGAFDGGLILSIFDSFDDTNEDGTFSGTLDYTITIDVLEVEDIIPPVITCAAQTTPVECPAAPVWVAPVVTDVCDAAPAVVFADAVVPGGCGGTSTVTRTWTATDACGNTATCAATIEVIDTPPVITCAAQTTPIECPAAPVWVAPVVTDACDAAPEVTFADVVVPGCGGTSTVTRTWTATDACGSTATCAATIEVIDTPPVITCAAQTTPIECPAAPVWVAPVVTDACDAAPEVTFADVVVPGCGGTSTVTRTWTATDACGSTATCAATIEVIDTPPVITCAAQTTPVECSAAPVWVAPVVTDACDTAPAVVFADAVVPGGCGGTSTVTRTWTATDACGNTATCAATIEIQDNTGPVLTCPADVTVACDESIEPESEAELTGTTTLSGTPGTSWPSDGEIDELVGSGSIPAGAIVTDVDINFGIDHSWTGDLNIDLISPDGDTVSILAGSCGNNSNVNATFDDEAGATIACSGYDDNPNREGACNDDYLNDAAISGTIEPVGMLSDFDGENATGNWTITIDDIVGGDGGCFAAYNIIVSWEIPGTEEGTGVATATDACGGDATVTFADAAVPGCGSASVITRTWTATDACGNTSTCDQTITVVDNVAPTLTCAAQTTQIECPATPVWVDPTVSDNCDTAPVITFADASVPICGNSATITRTWTATDACGNTATCSATMEVQDNTAPTLTCATQTTPIECPATPVWVDPTVSDNCDTAPVVTFSDASVSGCGNSATITRTWTATDACGNTATCSATIEVQDNTAPTLTCATQTTPIECPATPVWVDPTVSDNCDAAPVVTFADASVSGCGNSATITRTWTATDACGNTATCSATIEIQDNTAPVAPAAPAAFVGQCAADTPVSVDLTAVDNCDGAVVASPTDVVTPGACANSFTIERTWAFVDVCGNMSSVSQMITINDNTGPVLTCPADVTVACDESIEPESEAELTGTTTLSGTPGTSWLSDGEIDELVGSGSIPAGAIVTDVDINLGLDHSWTGDLNIDLISPEGDTVSILAGSCGNNSNVNATFDDEAGATIACSGYDGNPSTTGACNDDYLNDAAISGTIEPVGMLSDFDGENATGNWTITIDDIVGGDGGCFAAYNIIVSWEIPGAEEGTGVATATDACGGDATVTFADAAVPGCGSASVITRTWTATDACGNTSTCDQTITVVDNVAPTLICAAQTTQIECPATPVWVDPTVSDNCDTAPVVTFADASVPGCGNSATITRTWTATDACGNTATCSATIEVVDITPPTIVCPAAVTAECDAIDPTVTGMATGTDDCDTAPVVTFADVTTQGTGCAAGNYMITRTWTAIDACGNSATCDQLITVEDTTAPVLACPADVTIGCGDSPDPGTGGGAGAMATATDACTDVNSVTYADVLNPLTTGYSIARTWTATDACGNTSTCLQTITVEDCDVAIEDPCVCVNNSSVIDLDTGLGGGDGQFSELIAITGSNGGPVNNPNLVFEVIAITGGVDAFAPAPVPPAQTAGVPIPVGTQLVYNPVTMHYELPFYHYDGAGYSITVQQIVGGLPGQILGPIGNNCAYPDPIFDLALQSLYCPNGAAVTLEGIDQNGVGADGVTFTVDGAPATVFDPSAVAKGFYTIVMTFDGADDGNGGISPDGGTTPARPGCIQEVTQTVEVNDVEAPVITCPAAVNLSCTDAIDPANTGMATATDNCDAAPVITFTDVTTQGTEDCGQFNFSITRTWTATDACDNSTTCVQTISVSDTTPPVIICPADQTLTCFEAVPAPATTAADFIALGGTLSDDCTTDFSEFTVFAQNADNGGDNCPGNARTIVRTYFITDACGNTSSCEQTFTYQESTQGPVITSVLPECYKYCASLANPMETDITYETDCSFGATVDITGPTNIGQENCPGSIARYTYTVTDDCGRTSAPVTRDFIIGNDGPTIECAPFNLILECGDSNNQDYIDAHLDLISVNTSCELGYTVSTSPQNFNMIACGSSTVVTFVVTDDCGRSASCTTTVAIQDNTPPTFTAVPPSICDVTNCSADVNYWYNHWIDYMVTGLEAEDACDSNVSIQAVNTPLNTNCPNGDAETVVTFVATDNCGNEAEITGTFIVEATPSSLGVMGMIATEELETVANVTVTLEGGNGINQESITTNAGMYGFNGLIEGQNYSVTPFLDEDHLNGISSFDLVLIAKHILQLDLLDSPYKMIAADINKSGSITTMDMLELRKLILHVDNSFANNTSWRFVETAYVFPEPTNPFATTFPEEVYINALTANEEHDFVGVKIGDVNGTAAANLHAGAEDRSFNGNLFFEVEDQSMKAGETYELSFSSKDFQYIAGYQYTMNFDADLLEFVDVKSADLTGMSKANFGLDLLEEGAITTSWTTTLAVSMRADADLFRLTFKAKADVQLSEVLSISSRYTKAEAYDLITENGQLNLLNVGLRFKDESEGSNLFVLMQNTPNPFHNETVIGFVLPEATKATLTIFEMSGKQLEVVTGEYEAGYNEVVLNRSNLENGMLYYKLETAKHTSTKKMLLIDNN